MRLLWVFILAVIASGFSAAAQDMVYLIRHGEREPSGSDPALTADGRQRASAWAEMLQYAGIDAIITSDALRTRQTGKIIAEAQSLPVTSLPTDDVAGLVDVLAFDHEDDTVLVIAHTETLPRILQYLGVADDVTLDRSEFANLFVVADPFSQKPVFLRLHMP